MSAHEYFRSSLGTPLFRTDHRRIQFRINSGFTAGARNADGRPMVTADSDPQAALRQAIIPWHTIADSAIRFAPLESTPAGRDRNDGLHVMVLQDTPELRSVVGSALAVALLTFRTDGGIVDSDIVFNPNLGTASSPNPFSTTLAPNTWDLQSVATHEVGHALGAQHFVFLGAAMLHYQGFSSTTQSFVSSDEQALMTNLYPLPHAPLALGTIAGNVRFESGAPARGSIVNAIDPATGVSVGVVASRDDGGYAIRGVPPGRYLLYAEPLNGRVRPSNLALPDAQVDTVFRPRFFGGNTAPALLEVAAGATARADIAVSPVPPTIGIPTMGFYPPGGNTYFFGGGAEIVRAGQSHDMLLFGPGLDETITANNIRLLGPGVSIRPGSVRLDRSTVANGLPAIRLTVDAAQRTNRLMATVAVTKGDEMAVVSGGLVVAVPEAPATLTARLDAVNAASLAVAAIAPDSFVTLFGAGLAAQLIVADTSPFPDVLGGTRVLIRDRNGIERAAGLVFVAPNQVNLLVPPQTALGLGSLRLIAPAGGQSIPVVIERISPGIFTANSDGQGAPAALALIVKTDGSRAVEFLFEAGAGGRFVPRRVDLGGEGDQVFLLLFGNGIRGRTGNAAMTVGGESVPVLGAGAQGEFAGLDQVTAGPLPPSLAGRGEVDLVFTTDGKSANVVTISLR